MRDFFLPGFILSTPALAVLGHDIYIAYNNTELEGTDRFYLSDIGWLWTEYAPSSYDWVLSAVDETTWNGFIDPLLQQSAIYLASAPLVIFTIILLIMKIFGLGSFEGEGLKVPGITKTKLNKKGDYSFSGDKSKSRAKYKRK